MRSSRSAPKEGRSWRFTMRSTRLPQPELYRPRYAGSQSSMTKSRKSGTAARPARSPAQRGCEPFSKARHALRASSTVISAAEPTVVRTVLPFTVPCRTKLRCPDGRTRTPSPATRLSRTMYSVPPGFSLAMRVSVRRTFLALPVMTALPRAAAPEPRPSPAPSRPRDARISAWSPHCHDPAAGPPCGSSRRSTAPRWRNCDGCHAGEHRQGPPRRAAVSRRRPANSTAWSSLQWGTRSARNAAIRRGFPGAALQSQTVRGPVLLSAR